LGLTKDDRLDLVENSITSIQRVWKKLETGYKKTKQKKSQEFYRRKVM
jgi:hypothetical protein